MKHDTDNPTERKMGNSAFRYMMILPLVALGACGGSEAKSEEGDVKPVAVVLAPMDLVTAESRTMGVGITLSGNLDPSEVVAVKAQIPGTVSQVRVDRSTAVRR